MKTALLIGAVGVAAWLALSGGLYETHVDKNEFGHHTAIRTNRLTGAVCSRIVELNEPWTCDGEASAMLCGNGTWTRSGQCPQ